MRNFFTKHAVGALLCLATMAASPAAVASILTFHIMWSGVGGASAYASVTMESDVIDVGAGVAHQLTMDSVSSLSLTVQGAQAGNGTFGKSDFGAMNFYSHGPLDFRHELLGQNQAIGGMLSLPFGTPNALGNGGDFNLFGNNATAPVGVAAFSLVTNGLNDDAELLYVTSITASGAPVPSPVPEPASAALLLAGLGMVALRARRQA